LAEFHKIFAERWPTFKIYHNIARYPTWYNPSVFPEELKERIAKPLIDNDLPENIQKELKGIANFVMTPRVETVTPYGNKPTDTIESEIEWRWTLFKTQVVSGDKYRNEDFKVCFPELYDILKYHFVYHLELEQYETDPNYGTMEKGKVI